MATLIAGIGEIVVSKNPDDVLKTVALGSCVALIFWAPKLKLAGLAHVALPDSAAANGRTKKLPGYFADQAVPRLIQEFKKHGITSSAQVRIKLAGGAQIMDPKGTFNIGKRNVLALRKILWKYRLGAIAEDVGGNYSRSVVVDVNTGKVKVSSPKKGEWEI